MKNVNEETERRSFSMLISFYKQFVKFDDMPEIQEMHKHIIWGMLMMLNMQGIINSVEEDRIKDALNEHYTKNLRKEIRNDE